MKILNKEIILKDKKLNELSEIVETLQSCTKKYSRTSSALNDKISSNQLNILELNEKISSKCDELANSIKEIGSFELKFLQMEANLSGFNKENIKIEQQLTQSSEAIECLESCTKRHTDTINVLNEKVILIEELANNITDLSDNIALINDKSAELLEKMSNFEMRIKKTEENISKRNSKLNALFCISAVFFIISTCVIIKKKCKLTWLHDYSPIKFILYVFDMVVSLSFFT